MCSHAKESVNEFLVTYNCVHIYWTDHMTLGNKKRSNCALCQLMEYTDASPNLDMSEFCPVIAVIVFPVPSALDHGSQRAVLHHQLAC